MDDKHTPPLTASNRKPATAAEVHYFLRFDALEMMASAINDSNDVDLDSGMRSVCEEFVGDQIDPFIVEDDLDGNFDDDLFGDDTVHLTCLFRVEPRSATNGVKGNGQ